MGPQDIKHPVEPEGLRRGQPSSRASQDRGRAPFFRKALCGAAVFAVLGFLGYVFLSEEGLARNSGLREKKVVLEAEILRLEEENRQLTARQERLMNDPHFQEDEARRKLGLVREDEIIYRLAEEPDLTDEEVKEQLY
jgi:cell division protein FtsB/cell division protein DivIC